MKVGVSAAVVCFVLLVTFGLYVPASRDATWFVAELKREHTMNAAVWGTDHALKVLDRALEMSVIWLDGGPGQDQVVRRAAPPPVDIPVASAIAGISTRVADSEYVRSVRTALLLAIYRLSELIEAAPVALLFLVAAVADGLVRRVVKSKEFETHSPEVFGLHLIGMVVIISAGVVSLFVPLVLNPIVPVALPLLLAISVSYAIANYHRRMG